MYAFTQDVPIDVATHERIMEEIGPEVPEGLVAHVVSVRPEGGLRYLDVWTSKEACERFVEARLHPVVHAMLAQVFGDDLPPEPARELVEVVGVWAPRGA